MRKKEFSNEMRIVGTKNQLIARWRKFANAWIKLASESSKPKLKNEYLIRATVIEFCINELEMLEERKK